MKFELKSIEEFYKDEKYKDHVIVFTPDRGFESATYYNGSKTWKSIITGEEIKPTNWLDLINN